MIGRATHSSDDMKSICCKVLHYRNAEPLRYEEWLDLDTAAKMDNPEGTVTVEVSATLIKELVDAC